VARIEEDDPLPGPSTKAAEFDLEVFDSGSSCSLEDLYLAGKSPEPAGKKTSKSGGKAKVKRSRSQRRRSDRQECRGDCDSTSSSSSSSPSYVGDCPGVTRVDSEEYLLKIMEASEQPEVPPEDGQNVAASALVLPAPAPAVEEPPVSACPSENEDEEEEEAVNDEPASSSAASPQPSTSGLTSTGKRQRPTSTMEKPESRSASGVAANEDNTDEILQDHDNFGTHENEEDSLDSIDLGQSSEPSTPTVLAAKEKRPFTQMRVQLLLNDRHLKEEGEDEVVVVNDGDEVAINVGDDDDNMAQDEAPGLEVMPLLELPTKRKSEDASATSATDREEGPASPKKRRAEDLLQEVQSSGVAVSASSMIPDRDNPPVEMLDWLDKFSRWSQAERLLAIDGLIGRCMPTQVRHMLAVIEPQFQRDFISLLPKEVALYVLAFLNPRDLLRAAQTCRYWRILCEDNLLWREKCKESGVDDFVSVMRSRVGLRGGDGDGHQQPKQRQHSRTAVPSSEFAYSQWKASFMRQHNIEMNWRVRQVRPPKVLKGHDDHVITCLQFGDDRIVSGSDDNTLKVSESLSLHAFILLRFAGMVRRDRQMPKDVGRPHRRRVVLADGGQRHRQRQHRPHAQGVER